MDKNMERLLIATESKNLEWGFFGTLKSNYGFNQRQTEKIFEYACLSIAIRHNLDKGTVRDYLDSRSGRHFADDLSFYGIAHGSNYIATMDAIEVAWLESNWLKDFKKYREEK